MFDAKKNHQRKDYDIIEGVQWKSGAEDKLYIIEASQGFDI